MLLQTSTTGALLYIKAHDRDFGVVMVASYTYEPGDNLPRRDHAFFRVVKPVGKSDELYIQVGHWPDGHDKPAARYTRAVLAAIGAREMVPVQDDYYFGPFTQVAADAFLGLAEGAENKRVKMKPQRTQPPQPAI